jgi:hypothetical protein
MQGAPEVALGVAIEPPEPFEADAQPARAAPAHLVAGGDDPGHQRPARAPVGAVRRVAGERQVDLVRHLERHHTAYAAEAPDHLANVAAPCGDVALLARVGVVADLELDQVAAAGEAAGQPQVAPKAAFAVRPEEAVETQHERPSRGAQTSERRVRSARPLRGCGRRVGADLSRLSERPDPRSEASARGGA